MANNIIINKKASTSNFIQDSTPPVAPAVSTATQIFTETQSKALALKPVLTTEEASLFNTLKGAFSALLFKSVQALELPDCSFGHYFAEKVLQLGSISAAPKFKENPDKTLHCTLTFPTDRIIELKKLPQGNKITCPMRVKIAKQVNISLNIKHGIIAFDDKSLIGEIDVKILGFTKTFDLPLHSLQQCTKTGALIVKAYLGELVEKALLPVIEKLTGKTVKNPAHFSSQTLVNILDLNL